MHLARIILLFYSFNSTQTLRLLKDLQKYTVVDVTDLICKR